MKLTSLVILPFLALSTSLRSSHFPFSSSFTYLSLETDLPPAFRFTNPTGEDRSSSRFRRSSNHLSHTSALSSLSLLHPLTHSSSLHRFSPSQIVKELIGIANVIAQQSSRPTEAGIDGGEEDEEAMIAALQAAVAGAGRE